MRATSCRRSFVLLSEGGVVIRWQCGAELLCPEETAVDVEILADRYPQAHHHHRLHR